MKETKTSLLQLRLTPKEKELIREYAEMRGLTMSEAIRQLCL